MMRTGIVLSLIFVGLVLPAETVLAQRAGQSVTVRTGIVTGMRSVDLNDKSALGGALVGGAFGAALTRSSKGSSRRDRNAAIGAVLGGAAAASSRTPGRVYNVQTNDGTAIQVATEQTEIRVDDCVFVEELKEEAAECAVAKKALIDADDDAAIDRAVRKVKLLCYD